jgi:fructosamine-3-kinase
MPGVDIPQEVSRAVTERLGPIQAFHRVGGGCIDPAVRVEFEAAPPAFLKWSRQVGPPRFGIEARGLDALRERIRGGAGDPNDSPEAPGGPEDSRLAVPRVLGWDDGTPQAPGWLLLEWVAPGRETERSGRLLGLGLAHLHRPLPQGSVPGWEEGGWIATLPQPNPALSPWPTFWAQSRLLPQWRRARDAGRIPAEVEPEMDRLLDALPSALSGWEKDGLSLLHGDLWGGNVLVDRTDKPFLVDPAIYRGHREVDLAMLELFGSPGRSFDATYREAAPLAPGYEELRRGIYQLYPLLVHVNLFGSGYLRRTLSTLRESLAALE